MHSFLVSILLLLKMGYDSDQKKFRFKNKIFFFLLFQQKTISKGEGNVGSVLIENAKNSDAGRYICVGVNSIDQTKLNDTLIVISFI
jgi:hypothetical protein